VSDRSEHTPFREPRTSTPPRLSRRVVTALLVGTLVFMYQLTVLGAGGADGTDFAQLWHAARALLAGGDPYDVVGPGRQFDWPAPLLYPLTAVVVVAPLGWLSLESATALFSGVGAALLTLGVTRARWYPLLVLGSLPFLYAVEVGQWSPMLVGAALLPSLGFVLAAKPTVGLALLVYHPRRRAIIGCCALVALSLLLVPSWPAEWLHAVRGGTAINGSASDAATTLSSGDVRQWPYVAPITRLAGPFLLLAILRWRRPEARLLLVLAAVPQTPLLYEALPLLLVPRTRNQTGALVALSLTVFLIIRLRGAGSIQQWYDLSGELITLLLYLPCLAMVLRRPNEGSAPAWVERLMRRARLPGKLIGTSA
jgi:hypothetical protein